MDSASDLWVRSGKHAEYLFHGSTAQIIKELQAWVERRRAYNDAHMDVSWNVIRGMDAVQRLFDHSIQGEDGQSPWMISQISMNEATQLENLERSRSLEKEKAGERLLADFLLASLRLRGICWPQIPRSEETQTDAYVCAFLGMLDRTFNPERELDVLEDSARINDWRAELRKRNAIWEQDTADDPVHTQQTREMAARFQQEVANNPTKSTMQAFADAAHGIMEPGAVDYIMRHNSTGDTSTPTNDGESTHATNAKNPTTVKPVAYIADMLGNIDIAAHPSSTIAANTPDKTNTAATSSSNAPTSNPENANTTAGPSSSKDQTAPGAEDQGEASKMSKAKKKREGRKRAKAARATDAAGNAEDSAGNDGGDDDGSPAAMSMEERIEEVVMRARRIMGIGDEEDLADVWDMATHQRRQP